MTTLRWQGQELLPEPQGHAAHMQVIACSAAHVHAVACLCCPVHAIVCYAAHVHVIACFCCLCACPCLFMLPVCMLSLVYAACVHAVARLCCLHAYVVLLPQGLNWAGWSKWAAVMNQNIPFLLYYFLPFSTYFTCIKCVFLPF